MVQAIVILPAIGALIAGLITLFGSHPRRRRKTMRPAAPPGAGSRRTRMTITVMATTIRWTIATPGGRPAELITSALLVVAAVLSWIVFFQVGFNDGGLEEVTVLPWIQSGSLIAEWTLRIDTLTAVMLVVVTTVSALVHIYSIGYMSHDRHQARFFAYLSLFTFAMLLLGDGEQPRPALPRLGGRRPRLLSADRLLVQAAGRERRGDQGVHRQPRRRFRLRPRHLRHLLPVRLGQPLRLSSAAPRRWSGHTVNFLGWDLDALNLITLLLFIGAMGKSAQFLLHTWLPDAMEGPTPVSALIHAATMVTAGVFLVARMSPLFEHAHDTMIFVTFIGATTAFFGATVGLVQNDIKRVIAYSTCSQLGYMFVALGIGAYPVAIFHLFTHAFFKALLFLGAGSVIHAMGDEQDMRKMGGLCAEDPVDLRHDADRDAGADRLPLHGRLLFQGRDHRGGGRGRRRHRRLRPLDDDHRRGASRRSIRGG